ncbi:MAG TPA: crosslink repair DNA glycosylase YcaQ family protein, partial [Actinomycetota bacterium]|nr:crosslink repair DNA glycosylase YcaQ family protein [Actinomycetota bacterium]
DRLRGFLGEARMRYDEAGQGIGVHGNALRYAALTGAVAIRWEGARLPTVWTVPPPDVDAHAARLELARRFLHILGPTTPEAFAEWAGIAGRRGSEAFDALRRSMTPVRTPVGDAWILSRDEPTLREAPGPEAPARLLPSGDAYYLGGDRELLIPDADRRRELWTSRVWPGALLVEGEIVGTWRRSQGTVSVKAWRRLSRTARDAVETEAQGLPLPGLTGRIVVRWAS